MSIRKFNPDLIKDLSDRVPIECYSIKSYLLKQILESYELLFIDPPMQKDSKENRLYFDHIEKVASKLGMKDHDYAYGFLDLLKDSLVSSWGFGRSPLEFPITDIDTISFNVCNIRVLPRVPQPVINRASSKGGNKRVELGVVNKIKTKFPKEYSPTHNAIIMAFLITNTPIQPNMGICEAFGKSEGVSKYKNRVISIEKRIEATKSRLTDYREAYFIAKQLFENTKVDLIKSEIIEFVKFYNKFNIDRLEVDDVTG